MLTLSRDQPGPALAGQVPFLHGVEIRDDVADPGFAAELADLGSARTVYGPRQTIAASAVINLLGESEAARSRTPDIMADAAIALLTDAAKPTGARSSMLTC